jgi:hypothetical protein
MSLDNKRQLFFHGGYCYPALPALLKRIGNNLKIFFIRTFFQQEMVEYVQKKESNKKQKEKPLVLPKGRSKLAGLSQGFS